MSKKPKIPSAIFRAISLCNDLNIPYNYPKSSKPSIPPWHLSTENINTSLQRHLKSNTPPSIYKSLFRYLQNQFPDHISLFTDGSKNLHFCSYSITYVNSIIYRAFLPSFSSSFTAEIVAIDRAIEYVESKPQKFNIFTDSLSALQAIQNLNNASYYPLKIRQKLHKLRHKVNVIWIPSHIGITGNEFADLTAKEAIQYPLSTSPNFNSKDFDKFLKLNALSKRTTLWEQSSTYYRKCNPNKKTITDLSDSISNLNINRTNLCKITRIILGHSHQHLLTPEKNSSCQFCNSNPHSLLEHLIDNCTTFTAARSNIFKNTLPSSLLHTRNTSDINKILTFLKQTTLFSQI